MGMSFIPQVIYEHGEPLWNAIDRGKLLIHPSELSVVLPEEFSSSKAGGTSKGNYEFCLTKYPFHTSKGSLTCCKIL
jgi:hypothetical protein